MEQSEGPSEEEDATVSGKAGLALNGSSAGGNCDRQYEASVSLTDARNLMVRSQLGQGRGGKEVGDQHIKRAVSLDDGHLWPYKKARLVNEAMKAAFARQDVKTEPGSVKKGTEDSKKKPLPACSLLPAKSLPEAYDIRCYSLPLPIISKDFFKSPVTSVPKLQIKPLDISVGLFPPVSNSGSDTSKWLKGPLKTEDLQTDNIGKVAASLSHLRHSDASSAFQAVDKVISPKKTHVAVLKPQPQLSPPAFVPQIAKAAPPHQQRFSEAFQATMKQHRQAEVCAANRKAAILRFRAKRRQRSFEKKVRYASRKRLADQRPRVKGQFVKAIDLDKGSMQ